MGYNYIRGAAFAVATHRSKSCAVGFFGALCCCARLPCPLLIKDLPYEVARDFSPVALMAIFPTVLAETLPGYEAASWYGIVVPARTPQPVIARLHGEIARTLQQPDVRQRFMSLGGDIVSGGPDDLGKTMRGGTEKWSALVKEIDTQKR